MYDIHSTEVYFVLVLHDVGVHSLNINYRAWLVPVLAFVLFLYSMLFVILYTIHAMDKKVSFDTNRANTSGNKSSAAARIGDISKEMRKRLE